MIGLGVLFIKKSLFLLKYSLLKLIADDFFHNLILANSLNASGCLRSFQKPYYMSITDQLNSAQFNV